MNWLEDLGLLGLFLGTFLAATFVPFNSDTLFIVILMATKEPLACFVVATAGNWLGSITTYVLGRFAKWEWIEKVFKVSNEKLEAQKARIDKYGIWLALLSWVPFVGDVITLALGFYKTPWTWTLLLLLAGKAARFAVWMFLVGATIA